MSFGAVLGWKCVFRQLWILILACLWILELCFVNEESCCQANWPHWTVSWWSDITSRTCHLHNCYCSPWLPGLSSYSDTCQSSSLSTDRIMVRPATSVIKSGICSTGASKAKKFTRASFLCGFSERNLLPSSPVKHAYEFGKAGSSSDAPS